MNMSMTNCMRCGSANITGAAFCGGCGTQMQAASVPTGNNSRALIALVLGLLGLFFLWLPAIPGAIMAWSELTAIREGRSSQNNAGMAKLALGVGIAGSILPLIGFFGIILLGVALA